MFSRTAITSLVLLTTLLTTACDFESHGSVASPSELPPILLGRWSSGTRVPVSGAGGPTFPSRDSCSDLEWHVTSQTGTSISGDFQATCNGGITLTGTASGTLTDQVLTWQAVGTANIPDLASCPFTLNGTARLEGETIRIDYTGSTCLGPISGTEVLEKG